MRAGTLVIAALVAASTGRSAGAADYVDLQLVLAVDVSRSMEYTEQQLQREGYVAAFRSREVLQAITSGLYRRIAVTYVEWSGASYQVVVVPWFVIGTEEDALVFADALARAPISIDKNTSISAALSFAANAFTTSGVNSDRRTIDVSGDGANNEGQSLPPVRADVLKRDITINGLPILLNPTQTVSALGPVSLADYYEDCVIGGPGAFNIPIRARADFGPAIRRKLILEIAAVSPIIVPVVDSVRSTPKVDCVLAERLLAPQR